MNNARGRPIGGRTDAKERVLAEARRRFESAGYRQTTLRAIAAACDVDVALISYHFGSKRGLFSSAMRLTVSPVEVLEASSRDGALDARLLLANFVRIWEDPRTSDPLRVLAAEALDDAGHRAAMRQYLETELLPALAGLLRGPHRERRARSALYVLAGGIYAHHLLGIDERAAPEALYEDLLAPFTAALG